MGDPTYGVDGLLSYRIYELVKKNITLLLICLSSFKSKTFKKFTTKGFLTVNASKINAFQIF
jgi:hypothetical protein